MKYYICTVDAQSKYTTYQYNILYTYVYMVSGQYLIGTVYANGTTGIKETAF